MIEVEQREGVRVIRLAAPDRRNALSVEMVERITDRFADEDANVRATILTGTAEYFSAGADLAALTGTADDVVYDGLIADLRQAVEACSHPTLAAIDGYCFGAAVDLVTAFDLVVGHREATFAIPATRLGLLYDPAALDRMSRRVRLGGLAHLLLTGEAISAEAAHSAGLVDLVTDRSAGPEAVAIAEKVAANDTEAVNATALVLRAIRNQQLVDTDWQQRRLELMSSPARSRALSAARRPKRVSL